MRRIDQIVTRDEIDCLKMGCFNDIKWQWSDAVSNEWTNYDYSTMTELESVFNAINRPQFATLSDGMNVVEISNFRLIRRWSNVNSYIAAWEWTPDSDAQLWQWFNDNDCAAIEAMHSRYNQSTNICDIHISTDRCILKRDNRRFYLIWNRFGDDDRPLKRRMNEIKRDETGKWIIVDNDRLYPLYLNASVCLSIESVYRRMVESNETEIEFEMRDLCRFDLNRNTFVNTQNAIKYRCRRRLIRKSDKVMHTISYLRSVTHTFTQHLCLRFRIQSNYALLSMHASLTSAINRILDWNYASIHCK